MEFSISINLIVLCLIIFIVYLFKHNDECKINKQYIWPVSETLPDSIEYKGNGEIECVLHGLNYADIKDTNCWTVYISNSSLKDVEEYISHLKLNGFKYFNSDNLTEPKIMYDKECFFWIGCTDSCILKIYLDEKRLKEHIDSKYFNYNLRIEILEKDVTD